MSSKLNNIGAVSTVSFPKLRLLNIPARVDTGAKTSAIWASDVEEFDGGVKFKLFSDTSVYYTSIEIISDNYRVKKIRSSNGNVEKRYTVKLQALIQDRLINASFTLANRSTQKYPILIGRNIIRGKFVVDIKH